jgi:hypothetical protein
MAIGDPFPFTVPTVGSAGPAYATTINGILQEAINRLSVKVPLASIDFNSTANLAGSPLLNVGYITLANSVSTPAASPVNRLPAFNGDFWYVSPTGPIQITTGGALNAAGIGGITGDYGGANPAQFRFVDVDQRYDAYDNFGTGAWAFIRARSFDVAGGATSAAFARIAFGGSVSKTYTLPTAAASTSDTKPVYIDNTGQLSVGFASKPFHFSAIGALPATGAFGDLSPTQLVQGNVSNTNVSTQSFVKSIDNLLEGLVVTSVGIHINKATAGLSSFSVLKTINGGTAVSLGGASTNTIGAQTLTITLVSPETISTTASYSILASLVGVTNDKWSGFTVNANLPS